MSTTREVTGLGGPGRTVWLFSCMLCFPSVSSVKTEGNDNYWVSNSYGIFISQCWKAERGDMAWFVFLVWGLNCPARWAHEASNTFGAPILESSLNLSQCCGWRFGTGCLWATAFELYLSLSCYCLCILWATISHLSKPSWLCELKDQDYRTCPKYVKPSKLIRLGGVPETATKDDVSERDSSKNFCQGVLRGPFWSLMWFGWCLVSEAGSRSHWNIRSIWVFWFWVSLEVTI